MMDNKKILFIGENNFCMVAEHLAMQILKVEAESAVIKETPIHPNILKVLEENGIDTRICGKPSLLQDKDLEKFDYIVSVGEEYLKHPKTIVWDIKEMNIDNIDEVVEKIKDKIKTEHFDIEDISEPKKINKSPFVSVIVPCFNSEDYLDETLTSIKSQTYKKFEIILVNDGSTDRTIDIIKKFIKDNKKLKVRLIDKKKNREIGYARKLGVEKSKGEYIAFLSSDDVWKSNFLKRMVDSYEKGIIFCNYDIIKKNGSKMGTQNFPILSEYDRLHPFDKNDFAEICWEHALRKDMFVNYSCVFGHKDNFSGNNGFCEEITYGEDLFHLLRVCRKVQFSYLPESLIQYRHHEDNTTSLKMHKISENNKKIFKKLIEIEIKEKKDDEFLNILNIGERITPQMKEWKKHIDKYYDLYSKFKPSMQNLVYGPLDNQFKEIIKDTDIVIFHTSQISVELDELTKNKKVYVFVDNINSNKEILKEHKKDKTLFCNNLEIATKYEIKFIPYMDVKDFTKLLEEGNKKINILNISFSDCAGIMAKWKLLFDKYSKKYNLRNLVNIEHAFNYKLDLLPDSPDLIDVIKNTDIFIFHVGIVGGESITNGVIKDGANSRICNIDWYKYTKGKKVYAFLNGSNNLRHFEKEYNEILPKVYEKVMCSTPDLALLFNFAKFIPVPLDLDRPLIRRDNNKITICHLPTDPHIKNTREFKLACNELKEEFQDKFDYEIITLVSNEEAINIKTRYHLCFDHMQGYYGVNSLESASVGCIPLVGPNKENIKMLKDYVNSKDVPFNIVTSKEELKNAIKQYITNPEKIEVDSERCYKWMKEYWNPKQHLKKIEEVLEDEKRD